MNTYLKAFAIVFLNSCVLKSQQRASTQHIAQQIVSTPEKWRWHELDDQAFEEFFVSTYTTEAKALKKDHVLVTGLQPLLDQIDSRLRTKFPEQFQHTPKPKIRIIPQKNLNAFVSGIPLCYPLQLTLDSTVTGQHGYVDTVYLSSQQEKAQSFSATCLPARQEEVVEFLNAMSKNSSHCNLLQLDLVNKTALLNPLCPKDQSLAGKRMAKQIVFLSTSHYINIYAGLLSRLDEKSFIAIIAHELAHFYRAHATHFKHQFNYLYDESLYTHVEKPVKIDDPELQVTQLQEASQFLKFEANFVKTDLLFVHPSLFLAIGSSVISHCNQQNCSSSCQKAYDYMTGIEFWEKGGEFPLRGLNNTSSLEIKKFSELTTMCLSETNKAKLSLNELKKNVFSPIWNANLASIESKQLADNFKLYLAEDVVLNSYQSGENALDIFTKIGTALDAKRKDSQGLLKKFRDKGMGFYTTEQEADEVSMEISSMIGVTPEAVINTYLLLGQLSPLPTIFSHLSVDECRLALSNNTNTVPIGDLTDLHHHDCYRAFNLKYELEKHAYVVSDADLVQQIKIENYSKLQEIAKLL